VRPGLGGSDLTDVRLDIEPLTGADVKVHRSALVALLRDAVDGGASIGFLPPVAESEASVYWDAVATAVGEGSRVLLAAHDAELGLVGSAQLELALRPNAGHRAEVTKVMVDRRARRRGVGRALMLALESHARRLGRTTLILDTRQGDPSEALYRAVGWTFAGAIPRYARSATGTLDGTALYYKLLDPGS
jgi:acetyltransferase